MSTIYHPSKRIGWDQFISTRLPIGLTWAEPETKITDGHSFVFVLKPTKSIDTTHFEIYGYGDLSRYLLQRIGQFWDCDFVDEYIALALYRTGDYQLPLPRPTQWLMRQVDLATTGTSDIPDTVEREPETRVIFLVWSRQITYGYEEEQNKIEFAIQSAHTNEWAAKFVVEKHERDMEEAKEEYDKRLKEFQDAHQSEGQAGRECADWEITYNTGSSAGHPTTLASWEAAKEKLRSIRAHNASLLPPPEHIHDEWHVEMINVQQDLHHDRRQNKEAVQGDGGSNSS